MRNWWQAYKKRREDKVCMCRHTRKLHRKNGKMRNCSICGPGCGHFAGKSVFAKAF